MPASHVHHIIRNMSEPVAFEQKDPRTVVIGWNDGKVTDLGAHTLRLACPCAACIDEITGKPWLDPATVPEDVTIVESDVVGRYAFRFRFTDTPATEIYTFPALRKLAEG